MSVYFVYRSHYEGPSGKHVKRFGDPSVLDWFRNHWQGAAGDASYGRVRALLGCHVYGFNSLFEEIAAHGLPTPATYARLREMLDEHLYVEGEIRCDPHVIQVLTDDDELQIAYYFFDDHFLARHPDRAAFLLHEDWELPAGQADGGFKPAVATRKLTPKGPAAGTTYLAFLAYYDSSNLSDTLEGAVRIEGVRVSDLARYLARFTPGEEWPFEMTLLRSQLLADPEKAKPRERAFLEGIRADPGYDAGWLVYSDWLEDQGRPRADRVVLERALAGVSRYPVAPLTNTLSLGEFGRGGIASAREELDALVAQLGRRRQDHDPSKSLVRVDDHVAQMCLHTDRWGSRDLFHQWVAFDDLWASAHPALANAVLRYARRWDVLS
jgi:uncharacterized protein (TIGR02996 family)